MTAVCQQEPSVGNSAIVNDPELQRILAHTQASRGPVVILTGAGISAESGIPTFRGEEGYWTVGSRNYQPQELATWSAFQEMPDEIWAWYLYRLGICRGADPNPAHAAVVACERGLGDRFTLITQNVDGLHLRAGSTPERTFQIHGNIDFMRCAEECHTGIYPIPESVGMKQKGEKLSDDEAALLRCPKCSARSRPHVLWFDESYNEHFFKFDSSLAAASDCRLLIVVGTSGSTNLPNQVVGLALASGAKVIDINPTRNPFSKLAETGGGMWIESGAVAALPAIVARLIA